MSVNSNKKESTIQFRLTKSENNLIKNAAAIHGDDAKISEYVRQSALKQAQIDLASKTQYNVSQDEMSELLAALESPAVKNLALSQLLSEKTIFE